MSIDWFTFVAQILNFVLLVWLLKRFFYRPILNAIAAREKRISEELANAADSEAEAQRQRDAFQRKNAEIDRQRETLLADARKQAREEYERLVAEAHESSDEIGRKRMRALRDSVDNLNQAIGHRVQREVFAISDKILRELASESLQDRMLASVVARLQSLDTDAVDRLRGIVETDGKSLLLRSAFELTGQQIDRIRSALEAICAAEIDLRAEIEPQLVCGIELVANGHKIAWSVSDYLATLETEVARIMPALNAEQLTDTDTRQAEEDRP